MPQTGNGITEQTDIKQTAMTTEIEEALKVLKAGGLILYPTDTIWGIGCDATNPEAVEKVFRLKKRKDSKSLIVLASDADMVTKYVKEVPEMAYTLIEINDKPMTIIYPDAVGLAANVIAEDGSVGIRVPDNEFCKQLIKRFHKPIVSTSANISGSPAPAYYDDIEDEIINGVDYTVDPDLEEHCTRIASSIIKLGVGGEVEIIRH